MSKKNKQTTQNKNNAKTKRFRKQKQIHKIVVEKKTERFHNRKSRFANKYGFLSSIFRCVNVCEKIRLKFCHLSEIPAPHIFNVK